jgi:hypothetical protein
MQRRTFSFALFLSFEKSKPSVPVVSLFSFVGSQVDGSLMNLWFWGGLLGSVFLHSFETSYGLFSYFNVGFFKKQSKREVYPGKISLLHIYMSSLREVFGSIFLITK